MNSTQSLSLILTTVPSAEKASELASLFVEEKLCACVNIIKSIQSIYFWEGKVCNEEECLLLIKTPKNLVANLESRLKEVHPYEVPEFVVLNSAHVEEKYLSWAIKCVS